MIRRLKELLAGIAPGNEEGEGASLDLAVAVLLVEMARADFQLGADEEDTIQALLGQAFGLDQPAAQAMLREARVIAEDAVSMQEFTRTIHEGMDYPEKLSVIKMLWQVALADRDLDKYEDYLIGKLGDLLYISRGDVIRIRNKVSEALTN